MTKKTKILISRKVKENAERISTERQSGWGKSDKRTFWTAE
jgi:hypothetical protein